MEILKGLIIKGLSLYIKSRKTLIISDTQLGYIESLNSQGILIPRDNNFKAIKKRLSMLIESCNPETVVINGDIKHEFGKISKTEWKYSLELIDFLSKKSGLVLIKGNHDTILEPIAKKKAIILKDYFFIYGIYICHGHIIPKDSDFKSSKAIIIGHAHPAIALRDGPRAEKYKCFLKGKYKEKSLIVMPSFNEIAQGSDVLSEKLLSPFLDKGLADFEAYIVSDKIYYFGKIKEIASA